MSPDQFYRTRQADWKRLNTLLERAQGSVRRLSAGEVEEIGRLYRATTADLAYAQRDFPRHDVAHYLNQLTARTHATLYRGNPFAVSQIQHFFTHVIPQTFRETLPFFIVTLLIFFIPGILAGITVALYPDSATFLLPAQFLTIVPSVEDHDIWFDIATEDSPTTSAFITTNNIRVSFLAFAGGMTAGVFTLYVLLLNGVGFGGLMGLSAHHEFYPLFHFVIAHGVIELSMICLAGAAGLMFAWAILHPAPYSRSDALFLAGRKALILVVTCALFLIVAGIIEGFISPWGNSIPIPLKYATGIVSGLLMYTYLLKAGKETPTAS